MSADGGAYRLFIELPVTVEVRVGALGSQQFTPGIYVYVGSARRGLSARLARHRRLAEEKAGRRHWHIDALLLHPGSRLIRADALPGREECRLSRALARRRLSSVPVPGFGATDCRAGCAAHLYRVEPELAETL